MTRPNTTMLAVHEREVVRAALRSLSLSQSASDEMRREASRLHDLLTDADVDVHAPPR